MKTRPCEVDGNSCTFHRFVEWDRTYVQTDSFIRRDDLRTAKDLFDEVGIVSAPYEIKPIRQFAALIETEGGRLLRVEPEQVRFTDHEEADK